MNLELIRKKPVSDRHPTPILFVHGMWHAAWCWAEYFIPYFVRKGYECWAPSLRGHGASDGHEQLRWTSVSDYVADISRIAGQMDRPPVLVGHSMGGMVVQKYLEANAAPAAVLMAAVPPGGAIPATMRVFVRHPMVVARVNLRLSMFPVVGTPQLMQEMFFSPDMPEDRLKYYFSRIQEESFRAYLDILGLNLPKKNQIKTPLLVLGAANDKVISRRDVEATARAYHTRAEFFPDMAHDMMLETGWQKVADRIIEWLAERAL